MSDMITRCPKCHTSFRITQAQLQTAKGSVRCGSCLHIFKALDNLVQDKPVASKTAPKAVPKPAAKPAPKPVADAKPSAPPKPAVAPKPMVAQKPETKPEPRQFDNNNATVVRSIKPKFEYHKPAPAAVSAKDIEQALRSSIGADAPPPSKEPEAPPAEIEDLPLPKDALEEEELDFGIPDDVLDENDPPPIRDDEGQQNMLVFDQAAIDDDTDSPLIDDDDLLISDDMPLGDEDQKSVKGAYGDDLSESFLDMDNWAPKETSLFDRKSKPPKEEEDSDDKHSPDESWAVELLEDDDGDDDFSYSGVHKSLDEIDLEMDEPEFEPEEEYSRATTGSFNALEDSDIEDALGEPLGEHIEPKFDAKDAIKEEELYPEFEYNEDGYDEDSYGDEDYGGEYGGGDYYSQEDRHALLKGISAAPVEFTNGYKRNWKRTAIWSGAVSAGVFFLILQVAWLQFDTLSRQQPYRGLYTVFCPIFFCDVPPLAAPNMIRASNLVVRSHPNAEDALMVDTILLNTAPFNQPFPDLVLNFSDANGNTLAARRFKPGEYLGGELAGRSQMPVGQPVHLSLEIVDPGPEAVSYSAYIPN